MRAQGERALAGEMGTSILLFSPLLTKVKAEIWGLPTCRLASLNPPQVLLSKVAALNEIDLGVSNSGSWRFPLSLYLGFGFSPEIVALHSLSIQGSVNESRLNELRWWIRVPTRAALKLNIVPKQRRFPFR